MATARSHPSVTTRAERCGGLALTEGTRTRRAHGRAELHPAGAGDGQADHGLRAAVAAAVDEAARRALPPLRAAHRGTAVAEGAAAGRQRHGPAPRAGGHGRPAMTDPHVHMMRTYSLSRSQGK